MMSYSTRRKKRAVKIERKAALSRIVSRLLQDDVGFPICLIAVSMAYGAFLFKLSEYIL